MQNQRTPSHPVEPLFVARWSPRAYDASPIPERDLLTILEAARWAPSAFNVQPWRFLYARRGDQQWPAFLSVLDAFNREWAKESSALVFLLSDTVMPGDGSRPDKPSRYNSFDAGAAWAQLALQATALGYGAHAMAGLVFDEAPDILSIPPRYRLEIGIAIGKRADAAHLPEPLRRREEPSDRLPLNRIAFAGPFPTQATTMAAE